MVDFEALSVVAAPTTYTATIDWGDGVIETNLPVPQTVADDTNMQVTGHTSTR